MSPLLGRGDPALTRATLSHPVPPAAVAPALQMEKLRQRCGRRAGFLVGAPAESVGPGWGLAPAAPGWDNGEEIAVAYLITTHRSPAGPLLVKCGNATGWPVGTGGGGAPAGGQVRGAGPGGCVGLQGGRMGSPTSVCPHQVSCPSWPCCCCRGGRCPGGRCWGRALRVPPTGCAGPMSWSRPAGRSHCSTPPRRTSSASM